MDRRLITVFGGSGFIGRHLVPRLAAEGWIVRVVVRDPVKAEFLRVAGDVGQIVLLRGDAGNPASVARALRGAEAVVNLVGVLTEKRRGDFDRYHWKAAASIATAAREAGVGRLVHISALGADKTSDSAYARSKASGEDAVLAAFPGATVLRPSVVFGTSDDFFNRFGRLVANAPVIPIFTAFAPLFGPAPEHSHDAYRAGGTVFQPVWVGDVAQAVLRALNEPATMGRVFELGGPRRYSFKEILELILRETGHNPWLVPLPFGAARALARLMSVLPNPPLTIDQVKLLQVDNVVRGGKPGLTELGLVPTALEAIVPDYLKLYCCRN